MKCKEFNIDMLMEKRSYHNQIYQGIYLLQSTVQIVEMNSRVKCCQPYPSLGTFLWKTRA
jgi:hypothetical protein